ncbi:hypothetical protein D3C86_1275550 [compost metagenome]
MSVDQALAMGVNRSSRPFHALRSASVAACLARSAATPVDRQMARAAAILAFMTPRVRRTSGWSKIGAFFSPVQTLRP